MSQAQCLCGAVQWEFSGPFGWMSHCHCSRCRKAHGSSFATYVAAPADEFSLRGADAVRRFESAPTHVRHFCGHCGSVVPGEPSQGQASAPAGNLVDDPAARPLAHIFVASKAPWVEIKDGLPCFDEYTPGFDAPGLPDPVPLDPPGGVRGSCLCGGVAYVVEGQPIRCWNCHCGRCRRARSAAYATNLFTSVDDVRFSRGENLLVTYKLPEAQHFTQVFCATCGSPMPRLDRNRGFAVVPMGSLDDDPGIRPERHIFAASRPAWSVITDGLPQHDALPS